MRLLLLIALAGGTVAAQAPGAPPANGHAPGAAEPPGTFCDTDRSPIACQDTLRALVVFVRFSGDPTGEPDWPHTARDADGRPLPPTHLPPFARDLVAPTPEAVGRLTPEDSSLSAYFYWQSKHGPRGPHVLYGDVWPRNGRGEPEVYVTAPGRPDSYYHNTAPDRADRRGYGHLTRDVLDSLVASPGFDIGHYDRNRDGAVDHLLLVVKRDAAFTMQGWASLSGHEAAAGRPAGDLKYWSPSRRDSIRVDWTWSGSQALMGNWAHRASLAHEYAHRLFGMNGHTPMITEPANDVPSRRPDEVRRGRPACAYNRMCGLPFNYDDAAWTLSGYELRRMGWAARRVLDPAAGDRAGVTVRPLYTSGEVVLIPLKAGSPADTLSVENRQQNNFFDRLAPLDQRHYGMGEVWRDLAATGLLVTLSEGAPMGDFRRYRYDVLFADDHFDRPVRCSGDVPDCHPRGAYAGDTYRPGGAAQITPWTRPNTSGFSSYAAAPPGFEPNWFALTNVRYTGDADSTMAFDFDADVRDGLTITRNSWMGAETSGTAFTGPVVVAAGATLTVATGTALVFGGGLRVEHGARLVVEDGGDVRLGPGQRLDLLGRLDGVVGPR